MITRNVQRLITTITLLATVGAAFGQKENMDTIADAHHLAAYAVAAMLMMVFILIFTNRLYYYREQAVSSRTKQLNTQLGLVIDSNKTIVWTYDPLRKLYTVLAEHGQRRHHLSSPQMAAYFPDGGFDRLRSLIASIYDEEQSSGEIILSALPSPSASLITVSVSVSVLTRSSKGKPRLLIGTSRDITLQTRREESARQSALRYHTVFHSCLADMIFYDAEGRLTDLNQKAMETFCISNREALLQRGVHITDIPSYSQVDIHALHESVQISSVTDITRVKHEHERIPELQMQGRFYYEVNLCPIHNRHGHLMGVVAAGCDITETVESHHRQQHDSLLLARKTAEIEGFIRDINFTLSASGVRLINYNPRVHELEVMRDLNTVQYRLSQMRCGTLVAPSDRRRVRGLILRMDALRAKSFTTRVHTIFHDSQGRDVFLTFSLIPITAPDGTVTHYSGILRNETELTYTEMRLQEETLKAQETEKLKNTFLQNMSYEIRTPLNAVIGFAELFNAPHDTADEPVFAQEIKRNTGELLTLINDILFISRLDARMVEFNYAECDLAAVFEGYCYMGWSMLSPSVTATIDNPYSRLVVVIDEQNLGEVIRKLCVSAAYFTREGYVRAKYEYRHGELNIAIEDTGRGISTAMLPHIFERFVRDEYNEQCGSGLDLPIVQELIRQMGGSIEIQSELGKGSTAYIVLPCEMKEMVKKTESDETPPAL
jgi:signal transduction histidine kinase